MSYRETLEIHATLPWKPTTPIVPLKRELTEQEKIDAFCIQYALLCGGHMYIPNNDTTLYDHIMAHVYYEQPLKREIMKKMWPKLYKRLGKNITLERMQYFWRSEHSSTEEKHPVVVARVISCIQKPFKWRVKVIDPTLMKHNPDGVIVSLATPRIKVANDMYVFVHAQRIKLGSNEFSHGIIAEPVPASWFPT